MPDPNTHASEAESVERELSGAAPVVGSGGQFGMLTTMPEAWRASVSEFQPQNEIQRVALDYARAGLLPIAIRPGPKEYPPVGFTGGAFVPTPEGVRQHLATLRDGEVLAIRLPENLIGLDVDSGYLDRHGVLKRGGRALTRCESRIGALPPTLYSSRRDQRSVTPETRSAMYLFKVPERLIEQFHRKNRLTEWKHKPFGEHIDVEMVQLKHRYAVVWPSRTPDLSGELLSYSWYFDTERQRGVRVEQFAPELIDTRVAELPREWVRELLANNKNRVPTRLTDLRKPDELSGGADRTAEVLRAEAWCEELMPGFHDPELSPFMEQQAGRILGDLLAPGAERHNVTRDGIWRLLWLGIGDEQHPGNSGAGYAISRLIGEFIRLRGLDGQAPKGVSEAERLLIGAVTKAARQIESGQIKPLSVIARDLGRNLA